MTFIHICINYANFAWASAFKIKLQGILKKENMCDHANGFDHSRFVLKEMKALNVFEINIIQALKVMNKTKNEINPRIFLINFVR